MQEKEWLRVGSLTEEDEGALMASALGHTLYICQFI